MGSRLRMISVLMWILVDANEQTAFINNNDFDRETRQAAWAAEQRTLHGLGSAEVKPFGEKHTFREINTLAEEARRRAELARSVFIFKLFHNFISPFHDLSFFLLFLSISSSSSSSCRLRELHTLKGRVESFAKLRGLDVDAMNGHYTVWRCYDHYASLFCLYFLY